MRTEGHRIYGTQVTQFQKESKEQQVQMQEQERQLTQLLQFLSTLQREVSHLHLQCGGAADEPTSLVSKHSVSCFVFEAEAVTPGLSVLLQMLYLWLCRTGISKWGIWQCGAGGVSKKLGCNNVTRHNCHSAPNPVDCTPVQQFYTGQAS